MLNLTRLYAVPLALMMIGLSAYVSALRAKTSTSILDGGHIAEFLGDAGDREVSHVLILERVGSP